ncbi:hypothetical protein [Prevotella sp.]|uniref:hypothetical protein n=1 Tax=Prevotella sp. TaxID=59823 RepID=UPI003F816F60
MKHYLRFILVLLLSTVWCVGGYSQETKSVTCTLDKDANSCTSTGDCTVTWKYSSNPTTTDQPQNGMYWAIKANQTVTLTAKLSASDATITSVVITAYTNKGTGKTIDVTVGGRTFGETITLVNKSNDYTLTGSASGDLALIMKSTTDKKSHIVKTVKINYTDASSSNKTATKLSFEKPAFSFATTDDLTSFKGQTATLKAGETELTGKTIKYSKSGDDIFSSFNEADGTLALNGNAGTATVTANFDGTNDETYNSSSASYTITVNKIYGSLADLKKDITDTEKTFTLRLTNAVVSYAVGDRVYIEDESTGILIFYTNASNVLKAGQKLNGDVTVKAETYYKLPEITAWTPITLTAVDGSDIPLTKLTIADLINDYDKYEGRRIILENATVTTGTTGGDRAESGKISQGENEITLRTVAGIKTTKDDVIDVIGFLGKYNTGLQYNVFSQDDITVKSSVEATTLSFDTEVTEFNVEKGKEKTFTAPKATVKTTATGEIVEGAKVTYESNAPTIAAVDAEGNVTFGSVFGTATITASYSGDATHRASKNSYTINYGKVKTTMSWSATEVTANLGEEFTAPTLSLTADNVSILEGKTIKYTSTDENVAMVDENGKVVLMDKEGTTTITATFAGDETYAEASASYTLTVKDPNKLEVTFDFVKNKYGYEDQVPEGAKLTSEDVTITHVKNGTQYKTAFYDDSFRVYKGSQLNISVAAGYYMTKIEFDNNENNTFYCTPGTLNGNVWEGTASSIDLYVNGTNKFKTITVSYAKCPEVVVDENATQDDMLNLIIKNSNKVVNAKLNRTLIADGGWYTFSVPFDVKDVNSTALSGAEIRKYKSMNGSIMEFEATTELKAGHAYLVKPSVDITTPIFNSVTLSEGDNLKDGVNGYEFIATLGSTELKTNGTNLFLGADNKFYIPTETGKIMKALRGYFVAPSGESGSKMGINIDGETNYISTLNGSAVVYGKVYNLNGQYVGNDVKSLKKGVYVVNGRKFIVK